MLIHFGVIPYMVFDGDYLPSKAATEEERAEKRAESKRIGLELYKLGKPAQAQAELQKAVDVTPEMARQLIEELKRHSVQYVVAPYEADAQLAYLERKGIIQGIISEDSDLLVFGAKRLLTKLDQYGDCVEIHRSDFTACREISLVGWSDAEFRRMAILSGCDYLASISNMGLKTAYRLIRKYKNIERILRVLQLEGKYRVPSGYLENFRKAELTFLHQRVFCPEAKMLVMTTELEKEGEPEDFAFIGKPVDAELACGVARGDLNPMTKLPIVVATPTPSSSRGRPWPTPKRHSISTPSDSKGGQSIGSFFKAQRTPLAELDPNSFTPSPSQRRLLAQQNPVFSSTPVSSRPLLSRSTTSLPSSRNDGVTEAGRIRAAMMPATVPHPPKRQRLCEDDTVGDVMLPSDEGTIVETGRSRFFASSTADPSPSIKRNARLNQKPAPINIWSDDSIDEVILGLPETPYHKSKASKIHVYKDEGVHPNGVADVAVTTVQIEDSQESISTSTISEPLNSAFSSQCTTTTATQIDSQESATKLASQPSLPSSLPLQDFRYKPPQPKSPEKSSTAPLCPSNQPSKSQPIVPKPQIPPVKGTTPLQRIHQSALHRSKSSPKILSSFSTPKITPRSRIPCPHKPVTAPQSPNESPLELPDTPSDVSASSDPLGAASTPCKGHKDEPESLKAADLPLPPVGTGKGSEDLIVPSSDDDALSDSNGEVSIPPKLDLGRFLYSG
jgi:exonuclease-1